MLLTLRDIERLENTSFASVASALYPVGAESLDVRCIIGDISPGCLDVTMNCITKITDSTCTLADGASTMDVACYVNLSEDDCATISREQCPPTVTSICPPPPLAPALTLLMAVRQGMPEGAP